MKKKDKHILKIESVLIIPNRTHYGELHAIVIENGQRIDVAQSPTAIIDYNLRQQGSSIRGAKDGVKSILGNVNMPPVVISEQNGIYFMPTCSPTSDECMWIACHFIKSFEISGPHTAVNLKNNLTITVKMSKDAFQKRLQRSYMYRGIIEERTRQMYVAEPKPSPYKMIKLTKHNKYEME